MREDIAAVLSLCKPRIAHHRYAINEFYVAPDIPAKKLQNAIAKYAEGIETDKVIAPKAESFGSGEEGFIFVEDVIIGYHWKKFRFAMHDVRKKTAAHKTTPKLCAGQFQHPPCQFKRWMVSTLRR